MREHLLSYVYDLEAITLLLCNRTPCMPQSCFSPTLGIRTTPLWLSQSTRLKISHLFKASLKPSIGSPSIPPSSFINASPKMRPVHKIFTSHSSNCKSIPLIRRPCNMIDIFNSFEQLKSNTMQRPNPSSPRHLEHPKPERLTVNEPRRHRLNHLLRAHRMGGMIEEPDCNDDNICGAKNGADEVAARDAVGHDSAPRRSSSS